MTQVEMVPHQTLDVAFGAKFVETDRYDLEELPAIHIVNEDALLAIAARHDVIHRAAEPDPVPSGHAGSNTNPTPIANRR
jgi:hypothetical protein